MAIVKAKARQDAAVTRVSEGEDTYLRAMRDGSLIKADWKQALILEGRGFMFTVGALSTPVVGGGAAATAIDADGPDFLVGIPTGTSIMPLYIEVCLSQGIGTGDDNEIDILIAVDQDTMAASSMGTSTAEVIYNMNTLHSNSSNCYARSEYSATMSTDPVLDLELARVAKAFEMHTTAGVIWQECKLVYEPKTPPIINGPAMLCGFFGGTKAQSGFATVQWLELPSNLVTD